MVKSKYQQLSDEHKKLVHLHVAHCVGVGYTEPCASCKHDEDVFGSDSPMCEICHSWDRYEPNFEPSDRNLMVEYLWDMYYAKDEKLNDFLRGMGVGLNMDSPSDSDDSSEMTDLANDFLGQVMSILAPK